MVRGTARSLVPRLPLRTVATVRIVGYSDQSRLHESTAPLTTYKFKVYENKWLQIM